MLSKDITDRKELEEAVRESEERLRSLAENVPCVLMRFDRQLRIVYLNPQSDWYNAIPVERLIGRTNREVGIPEELCDLWDAALERVFNTGTQEEMEFDFAGPSGMRTFALKFTPEFGPGHAVRYVLGVSSDITERKRAEEALRTKETELRLIADTTPVILTRISKDLRYIYVNQTFVDVFGRKREEIIGKPIAEIMGEKAVERIRPYFERVLQGEPVEYETEIVYKGIGPRFMNVVYIPERNVHGEVIGWLASIQDVTDRKRAEEALRHIEQRLALAASATGIGIFESSSLTNDIAGTEQFGYLAGLCTTPSTTVTGIRMSHHYPRDQWAERVHPDDWQGLRAKINACQSQRRPLGAEYRVVDVDGTTRWVDVRGVFQDDDQGNATRFLGVIIDITERKKAEEKLAAANRQVQSIIDNTTSLIYAFDLEERFLLANKASAELLNSTPEQMIGKKRHELMPKDDADWHEANDREVIETGRALDFEEYSQLKGRSVTWFTTKFPLRDAQGRIYAVGGISADISDRKSAEEALQQLNENLERQVAERAKLAEDRAKQLRALVSELSTAEQRERQRLAKILHDHLQQILVAAKINGEVLSADTGTENKQTVENILNLISQALQTSRTLTAELSPPVLHLGLEAVLGWICRRMQETHGLTVDLQTAPGIEPQREDITIFLYQSARELLLNVVKHAGVRSSRVEMRRDEQGRLRLTVSDQGSGFDPDAAWHVEETGFGLLSIRERLELMGGRLEVESSPGNGASFTMIVPLETIEEGNENAIQQTMTKIRKTKTSGDIIRILLVDDHTVVRQGLSTMLNLHSDIQVVDEAADGEEAVEKARELQPDVILMDISMPKMDGIEATRIISSEFPHIRVIGLSMHDKQDQADRMIEAGASAYCTKDGATGVLLSAIRGE